MKSIAYIAGQFPLRSETFVYREVRELRKKGWNVVCVSLHPSTDPPEQSDDLIDDLITVYSPTCRAKGLASSAWIDALFPGEPIASTDRLKLLYQARAAAGLADALARRNVQHVHCHFAHAPTTIGMYAAQHLNIPFSFTGHANDLFQRRILLKRKLQRAKFVSCISYEHQKLYQQTVPRDPQAYPIIRCGVDVRSFTTSSELGSPPPIRILTVCRLVEKKGVDTLIRAFDQLSDLDAQLLIAGEGPQRNELKQLADQCAKKQNIQFLGAVSNDQVRQLLQSATIFALLCRVDRHGDKDGIPVVLMEAMACGLPVIAGDLPAVRELVIDQQTGLVVDATSPLPAVNALRYLITHPDSARSLGRSARDHVIREFSLETNIQRLEDALNR